MFTKYLYLLFFFLIAPTAQAALDYSFNIDSCDCYSGLELYDTTLQGSLLSCDYKGPVYSDNLGLDYPKINVDTWAYYNDSFIERYNTNTQKDYDRFSELSHYSIEDFYIRDDGASLIYYIPDAGYSTPRYSGRLLHLYKGHKITISAEEIAWNPQKDLDTIDKCMMQAVDAFISNEEKKLMGPGIHEKDGKLYINSAPGEVFNVKRSELPTWSQDELVVVGAMAATACAPNIITSGDPDILFNGLPVARDGDSTAHGNVLIDGSDKIFINGVPAAYKGQFVVSQLVLGNPCIGGPIITTGGTKVSESGDVDTDSVDDYLKSHSEDFRLTTEKVKKGSTVIQIDNEGIEIGDGVFIGNTHLKGEAVKVVDKGSLIIDRPLQYSYPAGTLVTLIPKESAELIVAPEDVVFIEEENDSSFVSLLSIILLIGISIFGYRKFKKN